MQAFLVSTGIVALAEIGDKTQLLAFILAARFKRPFPIIAGVLVATLLNHGLAGGLGAWLSDALNPRVLTWILAISFLLMAGWMLIPDKLDEDTRITAKHGVFITTVCTFFLAEMGDKTQLATVALAAQYEAFWSVVIGTTLGMMIANVPAIFIGQKLAERLPVKMVHAVAACVFLILGVIALYSAIQG
ncbi:TMEM165/GDT1 family protein [Alcaligenaceae bacterium 429]|nr:TMEM165/GDT1 family protein [Alcaligenaceae bacterium 429]